MRFFCASQGFVYNFIAVRNRSNWTQIVDFTARVTLGFDGWPGKTIGQLFHAPKNYMSDLLTIKDFQVIVWKR